MCGGTCRRRRWYPARPGLSPRVRGNPHRTTRLVGAARSIPACAGEPAGVPRSGGYHRVYPRVCGGTGEGEVGDDARGGLSPRVRGNRGCRPPFLRAYRSIPACAGEPYPLSRRKLYQPVYPRVCGGTAGNPPKGWWNIGLSPRVRGNLEQVGLGVSEDRSIPACAGEPNYRACGRRLSAVYPRVCGGTGSRDS